MIKIIKQTLYTQFVDDSTGEIFEDTREFLEDSIKPKRKTSTRSKKLFCKREKFLFLSFLNSAS